MNTVNQYTLTMIRREKHLVLPMVTSIILVQNLYDILFQYVIDADKEELLKRFIDQLEQHIKSKSDTPFSAPIKELEFLNEGLEELRLLNWMEVPVTVFSLELIEDDNEEAREVVIEHLRQLMLVRPVADSNLLYVYPTNIPC
ncbi:MAG: hypothetical protein ACOX6F_06465 [Syntrophomonadaceae bacterium]|jgi:hypothetical protein|nr:hypothetical protein [Bacillota bacterium]NLM88087.1 hypothetical protein [Syntrophomonadaceae bacterium]HAA09279.1 hypothetical protein [Syntrophomonas sp.]HQA50246.1 hypothetical protein [Syntrophomonadaceae bacterium]HQD90599.1 hypothetical protein [Syntrophomonadaceae bacterium]